MASIKTQQHHIHPGLGRSTTTTLSTTRRRTIRSRSTGLCSSSIKAFSSTCHPKALLLVWVQEPLLSIGISTSTINAYTTTAATTNNSQGTSSILFCILQTLIINITLASSTSSTI
jgi:hypothetical protein